jgi:hypothetical protein
MLSFHNLSCHAQSSSQQFVYGYGVALFFSW